jgi:starch synthase
VVASAVGGIPEVVMDGETGILVPLELSPDEPMTPVSPERFAGELASAINALVADPTRRAAMGAAGRCRAVEQFSWSSVADRTIELYASLAARAG